MWLGGHQSHCKFVAIFDFRLQNVTNLNVADGRQSRLTNTISNAEGSSGGDDEFGTNAWVAICMKVTVVDTNKEGKHQVLVRHKYNAE